MATFPRYKTAKVDTLIPYARNSRTHSESQVDKIAASIKEFGFLNPVILDGDNGIIAGHGRILAAKKLGMDEVPTVEASHLTDAQRRAYVIADNRLALDAGWDEEMLRVEFEELQYMGLDLSLTGFNPDQIDDISVEIEDLPEDDTVGRANEHGRLEKYLDQDVKMIRLTYHADDYDHVYDAIEQYMKQHNLEDISSAVLSKFLQG